MEMITKAVKRYKDGILLNTLYQRLYVRKTGFILYYLVAEGFFEADVRWVKPRLSPLEIANLGPSDMAGIAAKPERDHTEKEMLKMLEDGCGCLAIRHNSEIAAYMWYDLNRCSYKYLPFELAGNEAYLYGARTYRAYRGLALAPYLRQKTYEHLASKGRTRLYSITLYENTPSIMFKKKLKARNVKLYMRVRMFGGHSGNVLLKTYDGN
jgi:hypothetical protein